MTADIDSSGLPDRVRLVEVGPRDGLQSEAETLAPDIRVELVARLVASGAERIEVASFVNPTVVPQMAGAEAILEALGPSPSGVSYIGLVLNERGLDRALDTPVDEINLVVAASDGYSMANQRSSPRATMDALALLAPRAAAAGKFVSLTISVAFGDPYDGPVDPNRVAAVAAEASDWGVDEVALGDTIGVATPPSVKAIAELVGEAAGGRPVRCHFHDTRGTGLANLYAAMEVGISTFDTSVGGTGGSPFAPDAGGNVATEDAVFFLDQLSVGHGRDLDETIAVGRWLSHHLGHDLPAALQRVPRWP